MLRKIRGEGDNRAWDGWMTSPAQWAWVWAKWWRAGKPGMLQSMTSQSVRQDWATEHQQEQQPLTIKWTDFSSFDLPESNATTIVFLNRELKFPLPGESQGRGRTESDTTEVT